MATHDHGLLPNRDVAEWDVLLDLDALGEKEGENWVRDGASCLPGDTRCPIGSRGAAQTRP